MLWAGPYEIAIIVGVFAILTMGPVAAGWILARVRRRRAQRAASKGAAPPPT